MAASDHGDSCATSPIDHYCGASMRSDEINQGVTWCDWSMRISELHRAIRGLHSKILNEAGTTDGTCSECSHSWPCPTYHLVSGWNPDEDEEDWCPHAGVRL